MAAVSSIVMGYWLWRLGQEAARTAHADAAALHERLHREAAEDRRQLSAAAKAAQREIHREALLAQVREAFREGIVRIAREAPRAFPAQRYILSRGEFRQAPYQTKNPDWSQVYADLHGFVPDVLEATKIFEAELRNLLELAKKRDRISRHVARSVLLYPDRQKVEDVRVTEVLEKEISRAHEKLIILGMVQGSRSLPYPLPTGWPEEKSQEIRDAIVWAGALNKCDMLWAILDGWDTAVLADDHAAEEA